MTRCTFAMMVRHCVRVRHVRLAGADSRRGRMIPRSPITSLFGPPDYSRLRRRGARAEGTIRDGRDAAAILRR